MMNDIALREKLADAGRILESEGQGDYCMGHVTLRMPEELWPEIQQSLERLRPLASEALLATFQQRMSAEVESAFAEITRRLSAERA